MWTIPKGEPDADEDLLRTAKREFEEETGVKPSGQFVPLRPIKQKGGKVVHAWAFEGDCNTADIQSSTFAHGMAAEVGKAARVSPKWTGPSGSTWQRRGQRSNPDRKG